MEIAQPLIDIEARFQTVRLSSLKTQEERALLIRIADVDVKVGFDPLWANVTAPICEKHWERFRSSSTEGELEIFLAPADGEFVNAEHPAWNIAEPFQVRLNDRTGTWIFHRDFTLLFDARHKGRKVYAWLAQPTSLHTDALDNIISLAVRSAAEKHEAFLFHSAIVEHGEKAVVFFGPSGIGKSTLAKLSLDRGLRVMASDQGYLRIDQGKLWATASPTCNPDIPRDLKHWAVTPLEVKAVIALKRTGSLEIKPLDRSEVVRRFFAEIFRDETDQDFTASLQFASDVAVLKEMKFASLSYPKGLDFWPALQELGYIERCRGSENANRSEKFT